MATSQELQTALNHINEALLTVSAHLNEAAFSPATRTELGEAETALRKTATLLSRERNAIGHEERRTNVRA